MDNIMKCVLDIGEQMLLCGGEVHRTEDSMRRICHACKARKVEVFTITSVIVLTLEDEKGNIHTQIREIKNGTSNMEMLHNLNSLSRQICKMGCIPEDFDERLEEIKNTKRYRKTVMFLANALMAGAFTIFFGGSFVESGVAFLAGGIVYLMILIAEKAKFNNVFSKLLSSTSAAIIAFAAYRMGVVSTVDYIMIGCIMLMIPGTGLTNALRDLFVGDSIAGMLRTTDALLSTLAIAMGYFVVAFLAGGM